MDIIVKTERFGPVSVPIVRKRIKNINLRVRSDGTVVVSAPVFTTEKRIRAFVESKAGWIEERLSKREDSLRPEDKTALIVDGKIRYLGNTYNVISFKGAPKVTIAGDCFGIFTNGDPEKTLAKWWRKRAREIFSAEIDRQYESIFRPLVKRKPDLYVRRTTSRWGSCNFVRYRINLNELLLKGDMAGIEYVVLHEMTHLLYPDHGAGFHAFLASHMPDYRERKRSLSEINKKSLI